MKELNDEIREILRNFPSNKLWSDGDLVQELQRALKSKSELTKKSVINKYYLWKNH